MRIRTVSATIAALLMTLAIGVGPALGHLPTAGAAKGNFTADQDVTFKYSGVPPSWMTGAVTDELANYYHNSHHNSHAPSLRYSSTGTATIYYSSASTSPCGSGSTAWIQCTTGGGTTSWHIYVRNFAGAPLGSGAWWELSPHCSGTSCWYLHRAAIHESGHAMLTFPDLSGQDELNTVMNGLDPSVGSTGATPWYYRRCDEAASQLVWDMFNTSGEVPDCYDHITNHGVGGLKTVVTLAANGTLFCTGSAASFSGSLHIGSDTTNYKAMSGDGLTLRTVYLQRASHGSTTFADIATLTTTSFANFSTTNSSPAGAWDFRSSFKAAAAIDAGLATDTSPVITVTWSNACGGIAVRLVWSWLAGHAARPRPSRSWRTQSASATSRSLIASFV